MQSDKTVNGDLLVKNFVVRSAAMAQALPAAMLLSAACTLLLAPARAADAQAAAGSDTAVAPLVPPADAAAMPPLLPCPERIGAGSPVAPLAPALAGAIRERVKKRVGGVPTSVCAMPFGLFEVAVDGEIIYVDERANYLIAGNAFDLRSQENLTSLRKDEILRVDFKSLPFDLAVKTVRGSGARVLAVFEDPNCPYCKRFEKDIATLTDTTIYTFLYPILSRDANAADDSYPKSRAIWCAPDRTLAWSSLMLQGAHLAAAPESCKAPLDQILALGQKMHITGTPTILFADGRRAPGAVPLDRLEKMMAAASAGAPSK